MQWRNTYAIFSNDPCTASGSTLEMHIIYILHDVSILLQTGVLVHTGVPEGKIPLVFLDHKDVPHDSNMTMNCLLKTLMLHKDRLGRELFLQLDNCYRENKNRYMMTFAALLVQLEVFEEVKRPT